MLLVRRETLLDFFNDLVALPGEFLVYDDGYRRRAHSYSDVGRASRGFAARLARHGLTQGRQGSALGREPSRVDRVLLGVPAPGRGGRADRLSLVTRVRGARARRGGRARGGRRRRGAALRSTHSTDAADLAPRGSGLERRRTDARRRDLARRRHADHLHVRRDRRTQGRRHPASQRAGQRGARGARGARSTAATPGRSCRCAS